ncbi:MAG: phosphonate ABC transporter ATP-binding protein [Burkholderiaceae bacterium]|jgi:phosphonate transport system ATP-binding protein|nr:phosphonate ABC transporter ATP-binding protein [Burkholderiaceae bacterium]
MSHAVHIHNLRKTFGACCAVDNVSLAVQPGEMVALLGASGSGKSTLLRHIAGLHRADPGSGALSVHGQQVQEDGRLAPGVRVVRSQIGVVFQQFNLVERSTVLVNVLAGLLHSMPGWRSHLQWFTPDERRRALRALDQVGIAEHAYKRASQLSGGQQQRAAIARALVQGARLLLADEPIASLDPESARRVMELLAEINRTHGVTVIVSLHQVDFALRYCPRTVALRAGQVIYDGASVALTSTRLRDLYGTDSDLVVGHVNDHLESAAAHPDAFGAHPVPALAAAA